MRNSRIFVTMRKVAGHIRHVQHIMWMGLILFSLSPCTVKQVLLNPVPIDYAQPLNKSKTTTQTNFCQYSPDENQRTPVVRQPGFSKPFEPVDFSVNQYFIAGAAKAQVNYSKTFPDNSPPKYILFKRLRIDIA